MAILDFREKKISGTSLGDDNVISYKHQKTLQSWRRLIYIVQNYFFPSLAKHQFFGGNFTLWSFGAILKFIIME